MDAERLTWKPDRVKLEELRPWRRNPRKIGKRQAERLLRSWERFGQVQTIAVGPDNQVYDGHQRLDVLAAAYGLDHEVWVLRSSRALTEGERERLTLALHAGATGSWDWDELITWSLTELQEWGLDEEFLDNLNRDQAALIDLLASEDGKESQRPESLVGSLVTSFGAPPFSVLDGKAGYWLKRKRQWTELCDMLAGREHLGTTFVGPNLNASQYDAGGSLFDPVLAELMYLWYSPPDGRVIDPFAGGPPRGIVAAFLGQEYVGVDLRPEQVDANKREAARLNIPGPEPSWIVGDSRVVLPTLEGGFDFLFTCPPYGDLEKYSDDPSDLSNMDWDGFIEAYREIIAHGVRLLRDNRFAAIVVGDVRDNSGHYRGFVHETHQAFVDAGTRLWNTHVYLVPIGTARLVARKPFVKSRKARRVHQEVLVYVKGDPVEAVAACGNVEAAIAHLEPELVD